MLKKALIFSLFFSFLTPCFGQDELNGFKYIIIPKSYDFLKEENQYRLNTLTKYLFDKKGYTTLLKGAEYPDDLMANPCIAATADLVNKSNMFTTKVTLVLRNCHDQLVFSGAEGRSKIKEYEQSYNEALRKSFVAYDTIIHTYDPSLALNAGMVQSQANAQSVENVPQAEEVVVAAAVTPEKSETLEVQETPKTSTVAVAAVPVVVKEEQPDVKEEQLEAKEAPASDPVIARSYKNENISFFLIDQNGKLTAYVGESNNENYKKGEMIGTFEKTSLPNVYRVSWKKKNQDIDETTAYFDDQGNLKIDIHRNGKIEVITFSQEK